MLQDKYSPPPLPLMLQDNYLGCSKNSEVFKMRRYSEVFNKTMENDLNQFIQRYLPGQDPQRLMGVWQNWDKQDLECLMDYYTSEETRLEAMEDLIRTAEVFEEVRIAREIQESKKELLSQTEKLAQLEAKLTKKRKRLTGQLAISAAWSAQLHAPTASSGPLVVPPASVPTASFGPLVAPPASFPTASFGPLVASPASVPTASVGPLVASPASVPTASFGPLVASPASVPTASFGPLVASPASVPTASFGPLVAHPASVPTAFGPLVAPPASVPTAFGPLVAPTASVLGGISELAQAVQLYSPIASSPLVSVHQVSAPLSFGTGFSFGNLRVVARSGGYAFETELSPPQSPPIFGQHFQLSHVQIQLSTATGHYPGPSGYGGLPDPPPTRPFGGGA